MGFYFAKKRRKRKQTTCSTFDVSIISHFHLHKNRTLHHPNIFRSTFTFFTLLFSAMILSIPTGVQAQLKINEKGVRPIKAGDTAMVFYANVSHAGSGEDAPIAGRLHMEKCCMTIPPDKQNTCGSIKLISGLGIVFHPNETHLLQMYFVNFDLYDREGDCVLQLLSKPKTQDESQQDWGKGDSFTIPFKTVKNQPGLLNRFLSVRNTKPYRICDSDNLNALHECSNYDDCLTRYAGDRSLFNKESGQCDATPECADTENYFLSIFTRKCENSHDLSYIQKTFTYEMVHLDPAHSGPHSSISPSLLQRNNGSSANLRPTPVCEHGYHVTGKNGRPSCTCHQGWRSLTMEEWKKKGGVMKGNEEDGIPFHHMCTVSLIDQKTRGLLLLGFIFVCLLIPCVSVLWIIRSKKQAEMLTTQDKMKKFLDELSSTSSDDENNKKQSEDVEKNPSRLKGSLQLINEMEEEEANKVITEITNRREPVVSKKPYKKDDDDKPHPPEPPPPPSPPPQTTTSGGTQSSQQQPGESASRPLSHPSSSILGDASVQGSSQPSMQPPAPPPPTRTQSSHSNLPQPTPKSSTGVGSSRIQTMKYLIPPGDFDDGLAYDIRTRYDKVNMNVVATQMPSTDDLLSMNRREKWGAHMPILPQGEEKGISVVIADCATIQLRDNTVMLNSLSSEEITQKKKEEWAEFIESISEEKVDLRPGHYSISVESGERRREYEEDEDDIEKYLRGSQFHQSSQSQLPDFQYFHKDHKPKAVKVQSVPGMMCYHPFSATSPHMHHQQMDLPEPPVHFVQKALQEMPVNEQASRTEAYRILSNLSNERLSSSQEASGGIKHGESIWSNIASENTKAMSTTPATSAFGSRVESSCDGDDDDFDDHVRTKRLYGDLGSDADSDDALEEIASSNNNNNNQEMNIKQTKTVYGHFRRQAPKMAFSQHPHEIDKQNGLQSVTPPSEIFHMNSSTDASTVTSRTVSSTDCEYWKHIGSYEEGNSNNSGQQHYYEQRDGGEGFSVGESSVSNTSVILGTETSSAYRIKSSLETALKVSRSRSGTNLLID